jgi:iron complex outermembrane receptor protein
MRLIPTLAALAAGIPGVITAAEPSTTIVVTAPTEPASQRSLAVSQATVAGIPGGAAVVPRSTFDTGKASTLRDQLATVPGVYVQSRFGSEESRLSIRGSGIQRTFHLRGVELRQDGVPLNQADGGGDFQTIEPLFTDHILVERGGNARTVANLGGSVDWVSPTGRTAAPAEVRVEGGSYGYRRVGAAGGFAQGAVDGFIGVAGYEQDGYRDHSHQSNKRATGNVGVQLGGGWDTRMFAGISDSDSELPGALTLAAFNADPRQAAFSAIARDTKRDYPLYRIANRTAWVGGDNRVDLGGSWIRKELYHPLSFAEIDQNSEDWAWIGRFTNASSLGDLGQRFTLGVTWQHGRTDAWQYGYAVPANAGRLPGNLRGALQADSLQRADNVLVDAEERIAPVAGFWAIAGLRYLTARRIFDDRYLANGDQSNRRTDTAVLPSFGLLWDRLPGIQAYTNLTWSAEPPTFAEYVQTDTSGQTRPQQDLAVQTARTIEVGTRGERERVGWDLSAYYAWVRDEYLAFQVAPGLTQTVNASDTVHRGVETGGHLVPLIGLRSDQDRVVVEGTYTWGSFRFVDDPRWGGRQLPGLPEHTARGELRYELRGWYVAGNVQFQNGWPVDFANTLHADRSAQLGAKAGYRSLDAGPSLWVEATNLTGRDYVATTGVANPAAAPINQELFNPGDGRALYLGGGWRF